MITKFREITALAQSIDRDRAHLVYLREKSTCIPSTLPGEPKVQTSPRGGGNIYAEAATDLAREIERKEAELKRMQDDIRGYIDGMHDFLPRQVLTFRYIDLLSWERIGELVGYSTRRVHQIESAALKKFS